VEQQKNKPNVGLVENQNSVWQHYNFRNFFYKLNSMSGPSHKGGALPAADGFVNGLTTDNSPIETRVPFGYGQRGKLPVTMH